MTSSTTTGNTTSSFAKVESLKGKSVTTASQFSRADILGLIQLARQFKDYLEGSDVPRPPLTLLQGKILTPLFYEDSSRTLSSFTCAMLRLGGTLLPFAASSSSINKGESLQDTVRCLAQYTHVLVLRHPEVSALHEALAVCDRCPLMNAGNGSGEHPSQALLDTLTMYEELGGVDGKVIAFIGDLKMGRTVHSLAHLLLSNFNVRKVYFVAPEALQLPATVLEKVREANHGKTSIAVVTGLNADIVAECDVLYTTRLQKERFLRETSANSAAALAAFEKAKEDLFIDKARLATAKPKMIVMHPLPRVDELCTDVDDDPRAAYFRQMRYGLYMRMAILYSVLGE